MRASYRVMVLFIVGAFLSSCGSHQCTEIGCQSGVTLELGTSDGVWADGEYTVSIDASDTVHQCSVQVPADLPAMGSVTSVDCGSNVDMIIEPEVECTETRTGDSVTQSCTPIADHFLFRAMLPSTPESISVVVLRDGIELLNTIRSPAYESLRPNGPQCEPTCRQANVELLLSK